MVAGTMTAQFLFHILMYTLLLIICVLVGYLWAASRIWYSDDPWWYILNFVEDNLIIVFALIVLFGCISISCIYFYRMAKMLEQVLGAVDDIYQERVNRVELPQVLSEAEHKLNEILGSMKENKRLAREAEQRKNDMIVYMAHDLKTPLTSVLGYLTILKDEEPASLELKEKYIHIAWSKAKRLENLISDFFEITKFNFATMKLEYGEVNMSRMLAQILYEFKPMMGEKGMEYEFQSDSDISVWCDIGKMERVFDNLIKNAIHYGYEDSKIFVSLKKNGTQGMELTVENQGPTIPKEKLNQIFDQFFRLDEARASKTGGTGLGLAIAKQIVELHGGVIRCESEEERICFTVVLQ